MQFYSYANPSNPVLVNAQLQSAIIEDDNAYYYTPGVTEQLINSIAKSGVNSITLAWVENVDPNTGQFETAGRQSLNSINTIAAIAHADGLTVALQPYIQIEAPGSNSPQLLSNYFGNYSILGTSQQAALNTFAAKFLPNYEAYLTNLGQIAQNIHAAYLAIGGEMTPLDSSVYDSSFWQQAISTARSVYSGNLTYVMYGAIIFYQNALDQTNPTAAGANDPLQNVDMYKYLDLVGAEIHDPLTTTTDPTFAQMMAGWAANTVATASPINILQTWAAYAQTFSKPLITAESGFSSSQFPYDPPNSTSAVPSGPGELPLLVQQAEFTQSFFDNLHLAPSELAGYSYLVSDSTGFNIPAASAAVGSPGWWQTYGWDLIDKPAYYTFLAETSGSNTFTGDNSGDTFVALVGRPTTINGGSGNDTIYSQQPFGGNFHEGAGNNTVIYWNSASSNSTITATSNTVTVAQDGSSFAADTLTNIQAVQFTDQTINTASLTKTASLPSAQLVELVDTYIAYFNRAPDAMGLDFWGSAVANGVSFATIANGFAGSTEATAAYPTTLSNQAFVTAVYTNVLGRNTDSGGLTFWTNELQSGGVTKASFVLNVIQSVLLQTGTTDAQYIANKEAVGAHFALTQGLSDGNWAKTVMASVNGTAASVAAANALTDGFAATAATSGGSELVMKIVGIVA